LGLAGKGLAGSGVIQRVKSRSQKKGKEKEKIFLLQPPSAKPEVAMVVIIIRDDTPRFLPLFAIGLLLTAASMTADSIALSRQTQRERRKRTHGRGANHVDWDAHVTGVDTAAALPIVTSSALI